MKTENAWDSLWAAQLRENQPYIEDAGFTAGVMAALPQAPDTEPETRKLRWLLVVLPPLLVITALAMHGGPWRRILAVWEWFAVGDTMSLLTGGAMLSAGLLVACGTWLARDMRVI